MDLCVTKRRLIKDVTLAAGDFTVDAENYLPGAAVNLAATLRNSGDVAVSNAVVAFYDGKPASGGVLITNITGPAGWRARRQTRSTCFGWSLSRRRIMCCMPWQTRRARSRSLTRGTTQAVLEHRRYGFGGVAGQPAGGANGAVRVIAQVQNLGAPTATNSVLAIRRNGDTATPLATVDVPMLEPGRLAQVALDLPPGTQPEGETIYRLFADETR